jgi:hypothetical protein
MTCCQFLALAAVQDSSQFSENGASATQVCEDTRVVLCVVGTNLGRFWRVLLYKIPPSFQERVLLYKIPPSFQEKTSLQHRFVMTPEWFCA